MRTKPSQWFLNPGFNFTGGALPIFRGPAAADYVYKFTGATQNVPLGELIWFRTSDSAATSLVKAASSQSGAFPSREIDAERCKLGAR